MNFIHNYQESLLNYPTIEPLDLYFLTEIPKSEVIIICNNI